MTDYILFDLDGTLADTAPDLAHALNLLRLENKLSALDFAAIRPLVSIGAAAMVRFAFSIDERDPRFEPLRQRFLTLYSENICKHTRLFPGMEKVLDFLDTDRQRWGIVTNKPGWLTQPLLKAMGLSTRTTCVVSGDTLSARKPSPEPLLHACQLLTCPPERTTYIGDALTDISAGLSAGMTTGVARYGYIDADTSLDSWGAHYIFEQPVDILEWLQK